jgi:hypothetical protein
MIPGVLLAAVIGGMFMIIAWKLPNPRKSAIKMELK